MTYQPISAKEKIDIVHRFAILAAEFENYDRYAEDIISVINTFAILNILEKKTLGVKKSNLGHMEKSCQEID